MKCIKQAIGCYESRQTSLERLRQHSVLRAIRDTDVGEKLRYCLREIGGRWTWDTLAYADFELCLAAAHAVEGFARLAATPSSPETAMVMHATCTVQP